jgi:hypothetical protein
MRKYLATVIGVLIGLLLVVGLLAPMPRSVDAAPSAAITPVSFSGQSGVGKKITFFDGRIAADTRVCVDLSQYSKMDLQYAFDQGTVVNTATLYLQWSNDYNPASAAGNFEATATITSTNVADGHGGNQYVLAGQYNCVFADVANTNTLGISVFGVAK